MVFEPLETIQEEQKASIASINHTVVLQLKEEEEVHKLVLTPQEQEEVHKLVNHEVVNFLKS